MGLRWRLSVAFLVIVAAPLIAAAVIVGRGVPHALDTSAANRLDASRAAVQSALAQRCERAQLLAQIVGFQVATAPPSRRQELIGGLVRDSSVDEYAVVVDSRGRVVARAGSLPAGSQPTPTALGSCTGGIRAALGSPLIADYADIRTTGSKAFGRAAVALPLDMRMTQDLAAASDADVTIIEAGRVFASTEPASTQRALARASDGLLDHGDENVAGRLVAAVRIPGSSAVAVISVPRSGLHNVLPIVLAVLIAVLLLAAALGAWLAQITTRPLAELSDAAARVAAGDLDTAIAVRGRDEVGQLAAAFNDMTRELRQYLGEVEASRNQLRDNLSRLGDTLSGTHDLGRILTVVLQTAVDSVGAAAGAAYLVQPGRDELHLRASHGLEAREAAARLPMGAGVAGAVAETGQGRQGRVGEAGLLLAEGEPRATEVMAVPLRAGGGVLGVLSLYDRVDGRPFDGDDLETMRTFAGHAAVALDNVQLHQEAQRLSVTDALTGLGNYRSFQQTLVREIERAARFGRSLGLLMIDLDRFKAVNDAHGHQIGNDVLTEVADRLRAEVREVDVVARYGGEEFVVVLPESDRDGAGHTADRICASIRRRPFRVGDLELAVTVSIGVAVFPVHGQTATVLIRAADDAMYAAKNAGRDQWRLPAAPPDAGASG